MSDFLNDPRVTAALTPGVLAFLKDNQPPADADHDFQIGHWIGTLAGAIAQLEKEVIKLGHAQQRIRELEADA